MKVGRLSRRLTLLGLTLLGVTFALPASSQAFVACSLSGTELTVNLTASDDSVTFQRFGDQVAVLTGSSLEDYSGDYYDQQTQILIPCSGGTPTVQNTDHVSVVQSPSAEFGSVTIDESAGPFEPGATPEGDGSSEIEFGLNMPGRRSAVGIKGSDGPDTIQIGTLPSTAPGVNLNVQADRSSPDLDVEAPGVSNFEVDSEGGDDSVSAMGGSGFAAPLRSGVLFAIGGAGNDFLQAGPLGAALGGEEGRDLLIGSPSEDLLDGGSGKDRMFAGHGSDRLYAADGRKDLVICGAGKRDYVVDDLVDRSLHCERGRQVHVRKHRPVPSVPFSAAAARLLAGAGTQG
jgi:Ca2+-binding RTX toxin-like protein